VVKVRAKVRQNNKKATVLQLKWVILLNFVKNQYFRQKGLFCVISSVFRQKRNPLEPHSVTCHPAAVTFQPLHHPHFNKKITSILLSILNILLTHKYTQHTQLHA